jgi:hypothetical protein
MRQEVQQTNPDNDILLRAERGGKEKQTFLFCTSAEGYPFF